ncbi:glycosyltransferase family 2 protein [Psychrobacter alimentarius]|uniref:glycosyltransferase family 2 protein n=1 Tax=Psychrobacter alimentarius TaxID=261164 RepID=UPI003FD50234
MSINEVTLTVGLPVYNSEECIVKSINSVLNQRWFGSFELLIVDDGSNDNTVKIINSLDDPRIRLIQHETNKGRPVARNTILKNAKGKYLTWIDADDEWNLNKLKIQFDELMKHRNQERIICISPYNLKWEHANRYRLRSHQPSDDSLRDVLSGKIPAYLWTMLSLKSVYERAGLFDERLNRLQDLDMIIRILKTGVSFVRTDKNTPLCNYYKTDSDKAGTEVFNAIDTIWKKHKTLYRLYGVKFVKKTRHGHFELSARHSMKNEGVHMALKFYVYSFIKAPRITFRTTRNFFRSN